MLYACNASLYEENWEQFTIGRVWGIIVRYIKQIPAAMPKIGILTTMPKYIKGEYFMSESTLSIKNLYATTQICPHANYS